MNHDQYARLVAALHEHAIGITAEVAAVDLIATHRVWLARPDFGPFIQHGRCHPTGAPMASIRWRAAVTALRPGPVALLLIRGRHPAHRRRPRRRRPDPTT